MKSLARTLGFMVLLATLGSCMTTKTTVGKFDDSRTASYTYAKGKQVWLFWGLAPMGRTNVRTPDEGNCQVVTKQNFGDVLISGLTGGLVRTHTIKVKVNQNPQQALSLQEGK